jgi:hypothetical protein
MQAKTAAPVMLSYVTKMAINYATDNLRFSVIAKKVTVALHCL